MKPLYFPAMTLATFLVSGMAGAPAVAQTATPPYQLSVFASAPNGLSAPDSIAVLRDHVFVGYGDGNAPDKGLKGPGGLVFVDTTPREEGQREESGDACRDRGEDSH